MVIFLLTDIEKSTEKWEKYHALMGSALAKHDSIMRRLIPKHGGRIIKHTGDGIFAVFDGGTPIACAIGLQIALQNEDWGDIGELRVRMALHSGETEERDKDHFGPTINRAARLLSAGWGGQILLTEQARDYLSLPQGAQFVDMGVHVLKDISEPLHIFQLLSPDLHLQEFPSLVTISAHPNNLPLHHTPFFGRQQEIAEITARITDGNVRLLSIVGPGGMGKTRLALEVAVGLLEQFPYGVYFVQLAPLQNADAVIPAIAGALGFTFYRQDDPQRQLVDFLRDKSLLLVLDNLEHLIPAVTVVNELLIGASKLKIIVTSRERLKIGAETLFNLKGLPYPTGKADLADEEYSSIKLFLNKVQSHSPDFAPSDADLECIAVICALLDGLPLGIEIAASWIPLISCQELKDELDKSLIAISSPLVDLPDRHKSLNAIFEYSWNLLPVELVNLLMGLTVFRGSFSRIAAEKIAWANLMHLMALCDKSLLSTPLPGRFQLPIPLKQYAVTKIGEGSTDFADISAKHAGFYAQFLHDRKDDFDSDLSKQAMKETATEQDEIRLAWEWATAVVKTTELGMMMKSLFTFMDRSGYYKEGYHCFSTAYNAIVEKNPENADSVLRGLLLYRTKFEVRLTRYDDAIKSAEELLAMAVSQCLPELEADALGILGEVNYKRGKLADAEELIKQCLKIYDKLGIITKQMYSIQLLAMIEGMRGNYTRSAELFNECIAKASANADLTASVRLRLMYAQATRYSKEYDIAIKTYSECLPILKDIGDRVNYAGSLNNLSIIYDEIERTDEALALQEESLAIKREIGDRRAIAISLGSLGVLLMHVNDLARAEACFQEAIQITEQNNDRTNMAVSLLNYGYLLLLTQKLPQARDNLKRAYALASEIGYSNIIVSAVYFLALYLLLCGEKTKAVELFSFAEAQYSNQNLTSRDINLVREKISLCLDKPAFAKHSEIGKTLSPDEVIAYLISL
jgi:predicted ATPase/class 3 adenylate cyclase